MKNRTEQTTSGLIESTPDHMRVRQPDWMTDQQWGVLRAEITTKLDAITAHMLATQPHPDWCNLVDCREDRDDEIPEDERGTFHESDPVDEWQEEDSPDSRIRVEVSGYRNDDGNPDKDYVQVSVISRSTAGEEQGATYLVPDARRVAAALLAACELIEKGSA